MFILTEPRPTDCFPSLYGDYPSIPLPSQSQPLQQTHSLSFGARFSTVILFFTLFVTVFIKLCLNCIHGAPNIPFTVKVTTEVHFWLLVLCKGTIIKCLVFRKKKLSFKIHFLSLDSPSLPEIILNSPGSLIMLLID